MLKTGTISVKKKNVFLFVFSSSFAGRRKILHRWKWIIVVQECNY